MTDETATPDIASLLRDKVRSSAWDLLNRVDSIERRRNTNNKAEVASETSSTVLGSSMSAAGSSVHDQEDQDQGKHHKSDSNEFDESYNDVDDSFNNDEDDELEKIPRVDVQYLETLLQSPTTNASTSTTAPTSRTCTTELTRRLHQLAQERQEHSTSHFQRNNTTSKHLTSTTTFDALNLPPPLLQAVYELGWDRPSQIQANALPLILSKHNLIAQAPSGSGKTCCFTLGMLHALDLKRHCTQALCITPTRELAIQIVDKAVRPLSQNMPQPVTIQLAISGALPGTPAEEDAATTPRSSLQTQSRLATSMRQATHAHVVVGTPGKIVDWVKRKQLSLDHVQVFVLDEADTLMAQHAGGFRAHSLQIQKRLPKTCQCLCFSATYTASIKAFATQLIPHAHELYQDQGPRALVVQEIKQLAIDTRHYAGGKIVFLADIYALMTIGQSIVFCETKVDASLVQETLQQAGYTCSVLHGGLEAEERDSTMRDFCSGQSNVLITTNVLARGVDVDAVCLVINYSLPVDRFGKADYDTYLHRIGRTGRFGRRGTAVNLVASDEDVQVLNQIERFFSRDKPMIHSVEADPETLAEMIEI